MNIKVSKRKLAAASMICRSGGLFILSIRLLAFARDILVWYLVRVRSHQNAVCRDVCGSRMILNFSDTGLSRELIAEGIHEPISTGLVRRLLRPGMKVVDIGANIGYYAIQEAYLVGPTGQVFAIEPVGINTLCLKQNLVVNNLSNVTVLEYAVGSKTGTATMYLQLESNLGSLLKPPEYEGTIQVPVRTLDSLLLSQPHVDMVRMDIEGFELEAIEGMHGILQKHKPILFIELHVDAMGYDSTALLLKRIQSHGYMVKYVVDKAYEHPMVHGKHPNRHIETLTIDQMLSDPRVEQARAVLMCFFECERN